MSIFYDAEILVHKFSTWKSNENMTSAKGGKEIFSKW
jgi:hypothetical protein